MNTKTNLGKYISVFLCVGICLIFSNCGDKCEDNKKLKMSISSSSAAFNSEGGTKDIIVTCDFVVEVTAKPDWITVSKTGYTGEQIFHLTASKNKTDKTRESNVVFTEYQDCSSTDFTLTQSISVEQSGQE